MDRRRLHRRFDNECPLVSAKNLTLMGKHVKPGDPIPQEVPRAIRRRLWVARKANYAEAPTEFDLKPGEKKGEWIVFGPGLEDQVVKGKKNAQKLVDEINKELEEKRAEEAALKAEEDNKPVILLGSDVQPSSWAVGTITVQLGDVVAAAQEASGFATDEWNELSDYDREELISLQVDKSLKEAAEKLADEVVNGEKGTEEE